MRARVQPREAALKRLHLQLAALQERLVDARDLKLPARRGPDTLGHIHDLVRVEVQAHHCVVRFRVRRFLLDRQAVARRIELRHAVALGILDTVAEDRSLAILLGRADCLAKKARETRAVEDIVPQNQTHGVIADEIRADKECLCKTVRGRLLLYLSNQAAKAGSKSFRIPFDRQGLADHLNLDRSALSKELGKMRDEGILETTKNEFTLHELPE